MSRFHSFTEHIPLSIKDPLLDATFGLVDRIPFEEMRIAIKDFIESPYNQAVRSLTKEQRAVVSAFKAACGSSSTKFHSEKIGGNGENTRHFATTEEGVIYQLATDIQKPVRSVIDMAGTLKILNSSDAPIELRLALMSNLMETFVWRGQVVQEEAQ